MEKLIPDFAVFQNSRTHESAIWTSEKGEWHKCSRDEYPAILLLVTLLRESPNPEATMREITKIMRQGGAF